MFASEIKALFALPRRRPRDSIPQALDQIFTFWAPLAPRTMFEGVFELPPGHSLIVDDGADRDAARTGSSTTEVADPDDATQTSAAERLLELLVDATRIRLRADVPVGAYLSGGLDSTVITALDQAVHDDAAADVLGRVRRSGVRRERATSAR